MSHDCSIGLENFCALRSHLVQFKHVEQLFFPESPKGGGGGGGQMLP